MPGTTAPGSPYALPADPLVQWPATSQAVAARIDEVAAAPRKVIGGIVQYTESANPGAVRVTWPAGFFTTRPAIVVSSVNLPRTLFVGNVGGEVANGFTIEGMQPQDFAYWVAVEVR